MICKFSVRNQKSKCQINVSALKFEAGVECILCGSICFTQNRNIDVSHLYFFVGQSLEDFKGSVSDAITKQRILK